MVLFAIMSGRIDAKMLMNVKFALFWSMIADRPYTNGLQLGNCLILGFRSVAIALLNSDTSSFVANSNPTGEIITVGRVSLNAAIWFWFMLYTTCSMGKGMDSNLVSV
jgi:hypothetical protein